MLQYLQDNLPLALGSGALGAFASPQIKALWTKIRGTAAADIATLKQQAADDRATFGKQLADLQNDVTAIRSAIANSKPA